MMMQISEKVAVVFVFNFNLFNIHFRISEFLNDDDIVLPALVNHFLRPDACLRFADVRFSQIIHAQPRLPDPAANGKR